MAVIAIDYDKTIDGADYPEVGKPVDMAIETIREWAHGNTLILYTCRQGEDLHRAVQFLESQGVFFDYINQNTNRTVYSYGDCRKISADIYIDDKALFTPTTEDGCVDWDAVRQMV